MFSVIMPAYNAEKTISKSINSVLNQQFQDFELIVINDGSKDNTRKNIDSFDDERIICIDQENAGVSAARNRGIRASRGEFICFLDADDIWKDNHLEELFSLVGKYPECGIYVTGYDVLLNNGQIVQKSQQVLKHIGLENFMSNNGYEVLLKNGYFFCTDTVCCRREVFERVGLFEVGVTHAEDDDMWFRVLAYYAVAVSKKSTAVYDRSNSTSTATRVLIPESMFRKRVTELLESPSITDEMKDSLRMWYERNTLSLSRKYLLAQDKKAAWKLLRTVRLSKVSKKKYLETVLCMLIPTKMIVQYVDKRDQAYYH